MDIKLEIVTTPTADTPGTALVLSTQRRNYIFGNQSEGTQRALTEMGQRLTKVQDFFITGSTTWSNIGGLIGMALTLADSTSTSYDSALELYNQKKSMGRNAGVEPTKPKLAIYGPSNLKHALATARRFIFRKGMPITATEYRPGPASKSADGAIPPTWENEDIRLWPLSVAPKQPTADADAAKDAALAEARARFDSLQNSFDDHQRPESESDHDRELRYDRIRTAVLAHMFDSTWTFDTLVERHISEVEMPTVMYIRDPHTKQIAVYNGPKPGGDQPVPDIMVLTRTPWPGATVLNLPPTTPAPESVSYIVRTRSARGKFDVNRAKALGLKPGPIFMQLQRGESVTTEEGKTITPDMVLGPDRPGQGFALLDVPSVGHLEALVEREELTSSSVMEGVQACIWILGSGVAGHPTLIEFMQKLDKVKHVISSVDECPNRLALDSVARQTVRLSQIDPERYRVPFHDNATLPQIGTLGISSEKKPTVAGAMAADRGLKFRLMPQFEILETEIPPHIDISITKEATDPEILQLAKSAHEAIEQDKPRLEKWRRLLARPDTEVITLGTGSALPSKYRNVSATLVRVPGVGNYLFDCGENTLGQLQRVFGPDELPDVLRNLRMIWISHLHADHHLGTASVIRAWYATAHNCVPAQKPADMASISDSVSEYGLSVISHDGMLQWLKEYSSVEDFGYSRILPLQITPVKNGESSGSVLTRWPTEGTAPSESTLHRSDYQKVLGLADIQACRVSHCQGAMAVSLTFPSDGTDTVSPVTEKPLKVSYSGDCRPTYAFATIGLDSTVLIHEATFDDELLGDAKAKKHSTTSEALGIGAKMQAKAVVLTHFSQRYQKIPVLETVGNGEAAEAETKSEEAGAVDPNAIATEDVAEDQGVDVPDNVDMTSTNTQTPAAALPSDKAPAREKSLEKVIKIKAQDMKVAVAFDYMRMKIGDIAQLEKFNKALNRLLVVDDEKEAEEEIVVNSNGKRPSSSPQSGKVGEKKMKKEKQAKAKNSKRHN